MCATRHIRYNAIPPSTVLHVPEHPAAGMSWHRKPVGIAFAGRVQAHDPCDICLKVMSPVGERVARYPLLTALWAGNDVPVTGSVVPVNP